MRKVQERSCPNPGGISEWGVPRGLWSQSQPRAGGDVEVRTEPWLRCRGFATVEGTPVLAPCLAVPAVPDPMSGSIPALGDTMRRENCHLDFFVGG